MPHTQKNWTAHLAVDGVDYGFWAAAEGGGSSSEDGSYDNWDGKARLGGSKTREDVVLRRLYRELDHSQFKALDRAVGKGRIVLTRSPTDDDGISWGEPLVFTGVLAGAKAPDQDKSSSDGGELELTLQVDAELA